MSDEELSSVRDEIEKKRHCPECKTELKNISNKMWFCPFCDEYFDEDLFK